jgi:hypothetical protein
MISSGGFLKNPPLEIIFILNFLSFSNDLVWWNSQNKSCRSLKVIKLCSLQLFYLKSFRLSKIVCKFVKFKISNFANNLGWKSVKMKVVELQKLFKFVVNNFFIWIHLRSQTSNLYSVGCNMCATKLKTKIKHKASHRWNGRGGYARGVMWLGVRFLANRA